MVQKINPHGLRVGIIKDWDSCWYANDPDYSENLNTEYHELKIGKVKDWNSVIKQKIKCQN